MRRFLVGCLSVLSILGVLFLLIGGGGAYLVWWGIDRLRAPQEPSLPEYLLLTLTIHGNPPEAPSANLFQKLTGDGLTLREIVSRIDGAASDGRVQGLFVDLSDARLSLASAQELAQAIQRFKSRRKPTYVFADTLDETHGAIFTYALATHFDRIWLQPAGGLGIEGLALERPYFTEALKSLGILARGGQRHEFKGGIDMFTEAGLTPALRGSLQKLTDDLLKQAVEMIAKGRNITTEDVYSQVHVAPIPALAAVTHGFIDQIGYREDALRALKDVSHTSATFALDLYHAPDRLSNAALRVAVIEASGPIVRGHAKNDNPLTDGNEGFVAGRIAAAFAKAVDDPTIKGILFRINSPGGSYVASDTIWQSVKAAQTFGKPVVAVMGTYAASGGYFVAAPANKIVAQPGTVTGSIGVYNGKFVLSGLWEKLGIRWEQVASGESAGQQSPNRDYTPSEWARFQENLDRIYADFTQRVAAGRKIPMEAMDKIARGRVWSGVAAKEIGLVDRLGGMAEAVDEMRTLLQQPSDAQIRLIDMMAPENTFSRVQKLLSRLEGATAQILSLRSAAELLLKGESLYVPLARFE